MPSAPSQLCWNRRVEPLSPVTANVRLLTLITSPKVVAVHAYGMRSPEIRGRAASKLCRDESVHG